MASPAHRRAVAMGGAAKLLTGRAGRERGRLQGVRYFNRGASRRWVLESNPNHKAVTRATSPQAPSPALPLPPFPSPSRDFVPLALNTSGADIRIELRKGDQLITVHWPLSAAAQCLSALQDWLR